MTRRWVGVGLTLLMLLTTGACMRTMEVNPEDAAAELAESGVGNIRIVDKNGIVYLAQSLTETEEGNYLLETVERIDDGVSEYFVDTTIPRDDVVSVHYSKVNTWVVAGMVTATSLFMVWLYYKINTSVFD
ncbi:MAG: hypothetical protein H6693_00595 [Candidatus Latescibacteria bacterium]|nr:hypothetical protein [Candidatus Latescibacterota bacterium]